jgi:hypothetical protein
MVGECSDGWTTTHNFHICYARVRTMRGNRPDGWSRIGNFHISCTLPDQDWQTPGRGYLNCDSCLTETRVLTGYHIVQTVGRSFLYRNLERIWDWSSTERRPNVLLKRPDGCKLDRNISIKWRVWTEMHIVRTNDAWSDWRLDDMARRPDGWNNGQMGVRTGWLDCPDDWQGAEIFAVQSLLRVLWIVESLFTASLHI